MIKVQGTFFAPSLSTFSLQFWKGQINSFIFPVSISQISPQVEIHIHFFSRSLSKYLYPCSPIHLSDSHDHYKTLPSVYQAAKGMNDKSASSVQVSVVHLLYLPYHAHLISLVQAYTVTSKHTNGNTSSWMDYMNIFLPLAIYQLINFIRCGCTSLQFNFRWWQTVNRLDWRV